MKQLVLCLAAALIVAAVDVSVISRAWAQDGATIIDLSNIAGMAVETIAAVLLVIATWAVKRFASKLGVEIDAAKGAILDQALRRSITYASDYVNENYTDKAKIKTSNEFVAIAVPYVVSKVPDTLKHFKLGPDQLADMIKARLPEELAKVEQGGSV